MTTTRRNLSMVVALLALVGGAACGSGVPPRPAALDPSNPNGAESAPPSVSLAAADSPSAAGSDIAQAEGAEQHAGHNHAASSIVPKEPGSPSAPDRAGNADSSALYSCPMHPELKSAQPGKCPKCGMKLVPKEAAK
jgi:hypothetical protein